jgi:hypothetical protein
VRGCARIVDAVSTVARFIAGCSLHSKTVNPVTESIELRVVQAALSRCMADSPPKGVEHGLSRDASLLGEIIGEMIWRNAESISAIELSDSHREALTRWTQSLATPA